MIQIQAILSEKEDIHNFYMYCDPTKASKIALPQMKKILEGMLKDVKLEKSFCIRDAVPAYELCDTKEFRPTKKNTAIEVSIPYCLHIPQSYSCSVSIPEKGISAWVTFKKVWTDKGKGSSCTDLFAEDVVTYYSKYELITPTLPQPEKDGWSPLFEGKNVTKAKDNTGYFRYSTLFIEIDTDYDKDKLMNEEKYGARARKEILGKVLDVVNRILDIYRFITKETHIERVNPLNINIRDIYFVQDNIGFMGIMMGDGVESAVMNRSKNEMDQVNRMLKNGTACPLFELLFLNAEASYNKRMFTLALIEAFQALEIFLENFLTSKYSAASFSEKEIQKKLNHKWRTKERLKELLPEVGVPSPSSGKTFWDKWCTMYDKDRNNVIHKGKEINESKTRKAIDLNKQMVSWIKNNN